MSNRNGGIPSECEHRVLLGRVRTHVTMRIDGQTTFDSQSNIRFLIFPWTCISVLLSAAPRQCPRLPSVPDCAAFAPSVTERIEVEVSSNQTAGRSSRALTSHHSRAVRGLHRHRPHGPQHGHADPPPLSAPHRAYDAPLSLREIEISNTRSSAG